MAEKTLVEHTAPVQARIPDARRILARTAGDSIFLGKARRLNGEPLGQNWIPRLRAE